jgi:O-antigen/teichoic acid export membrane protein
LSWRWRREAWQTTLLAIFINFFADVGILGASAFLSNTEIAIFGLCLKLAMLIGYSVQIGQQMAVPDMADAEHNGDIARLRRAAWRSIVLPSTITLTSLAVVALFGHRLLGLFGPEFVSGRDALLILLTAQLLRSLAGPSTQLLTLSGIQSINMALAASSLAVLVMASALLMPRYGVDGAAYAVFITYSYWIGFSALALRWLKKPSVDVVWFALHILDRGRLQTEAVLDKPS